MSCWNTLTKSAKPVLEAFLSLGDSAVVSQNTMKSLELYVCKLYIPSTTLTSVNEARWHLFSKKQKTDEQLPPTQAVLHQMIKHANYVALSWKSCITSHPDLPDPTLHGWQKDGEMLRPVPTTLPPAPKPYYN